MSDVLALEARRDISILSLRVRCTFDDLDYVFEAEEGDTADEWRHHREETVRLKGRFLAWMRIFDPVAIVQRYDSNPSQESGSYKRALFMLYNKLYDVLTNCKSRHAQRRGPFLSTKALTNDLITTSSVSRSQGLCRRRRQGHCVPHHRDP